MKLSSEKNSNEYSQEFNLPTTFIYFSSIFSECLNVMYVPSRSLIVQVTTVKVTAFTGKARINVGVKPRNKDDTPPDCIVFLRQSYALLYCEDVTPSICILDLSTSTG